MTQRSTAFDTLVRDFRWSVPSRLNIAVDVVDRWAGIDPRRPAVLTRRDGGGRDVATYGDLAEASARLANALAGLGVARGDRVAILLPQSVEAVVAHLAVYRMAAVALPLAILFGADALEYRLRRAGARAVVTTVAGAERIAALRDRLPELSVVVATD
ncbi:AMP-binding protein, partial [Oharaeibacter diazotrophicus]